MRHRRTPDPGAQTRNQRSRTERGGPYEMPPWAAEESANDNASEERSQLRAVQADWEDDATTLYRKSDVNLRSLPRTHPRQSIAPAAPQLPARRVSSPDDVRFGIEGRLQRSLRPEAAPPGNPWRALPGLVLLGVGALFSVRALHSMMPLAYGRVLAPLAGAVTEVHPASRPQLPPMAASEPVAVPVAPAAVPVPASAPAAAMPSEAFSLADADALEGSAHKAARAPRKQHGHSAHVARGRAGLTRVIQPLRDAPDAEDEPEATPARSDVGILQVNSRPWARVMIDGRFVGHTPQLGLRVVAGKHHIQLVNEQMEMSKIFDVTVPAGQTVSRVELLEDNPTSSRK